MSENPLPPLSVEEYSDLKQSISERGVLVPIIVDQNGELLDGFHRQRAARELGVDCPVVQKDVPAGIERTLWVISLNLHRRHFDRDERRRVVQMLREKGMSVRAVASITGLSHSTVVKAKPGGENAPPASPGSTTGSDGKIYLSRDALARRRADIVRLLAEGALSQRQIAEAIGCHQSYVSRVAVAEAAKNAAPTPKSKPNGYTEKQSLRGLQDAAIQIEALADSIDRGLMGDWDRIRLHPEAQESFQRMEDYLPLLTSSVRRALRRWKEREGA